MRESVSRLWLAALYIMIAVLNFCLPPSKLGLVLAIGWFGFGVAQAVEWVWAWLATRRAKAVL